MANDFVISFKMDWTNPKRSTQDYIESVKKGIQGLEAERNKLEGRAGKGTPAQQATTASALKNANSNLSAAKTFEDEVTTTRKEIIARTQGLQQQLLYTDLLAEENIARRKNVLALQIATDQEYLNSKAGKELQAAEVQAAIEARRAAATRNVNSNRAFLGAANPQLAFSDPTVRRAANALNLEAQDKYEKELDRAQAQIRLNKVIEKQLSGGLQEYASTIAAGDAEQKRLNTEIAIAKDKLAAQPANANLQAEAQIAQAERQRAVTAATQAARASEFGPANLTNLEAIDSKKAASIASERATIQNRLLLGDKEALDLKAKEIVSQKNLQKALNERVTAELKLQSAANGTQAGFFQRLQANFKQRQGGPPQLAEDQQTFGQFFAGKATTTAAFALSGVALFGVTNGLKTAFDEAVKLQTQFSLIQEQLRQADQLGDFPQLREGILSIARETGIAGSDLAFLALQIRGAFSDQSVATVNRFLESAAKIAKVTGLPLNEITDSLTAVAKTYGITAQHIGDVSLGLQQRFGVLAKETIEFTAQLAPAAKQAGLSFNELATIGAHIQQLSGKSGASIADSLARILPSIQDNAQGLVEVLQEVPNGAGLANKAINLIGEGKTGAVLKLLIDNFSKLNKAQQQTVAQLLGGKREAQTLDSLFTGANKFSRELDNANSKGGQFTGALDNQFKELQTTLAQTFAQLKQVATQIGVALLNSGIAGAIKDIADAAGFLLSIVTRLLGPLQDLTQLLDIGGGKNLLTAAIEGALAVQTFKLVRGGSGQFGNSGKTGVGRFATGALDFATFGLAGGGSKGGTTALQDAQRAADAAAAKAEVEGRIAGNSIAKKAGAGIKGFVRNLFSPLSSGRGFAEGFTAADLGAAAISPLGIIAGITALQAVSAQIASANQSIDQHADKFKSQVDKQLQTGGAKTANNLLKNLNNFQDFSTTEKAYEATFGSGADSPRTIVQKKANEFLAKQARRQLEAFSGKNGLGNRTIGSFTTTYQRSIAENLFAGGIFQSDSETKSVTIKDMLKKLQDVTDPVVRKQLQAVLKAVKRQLIELGKDPSQLLKNAAKKARDTQFVTDVNTGDVPKNLSSLKALFDSGGISFADYVDQLKSDRDLAQKFANKAHGANRDAFVKAANDADIAIKSATSAQIKARTDQLEAIRRAQGKTFDSTDVALLTKQLGDRGFTDPKLRADTVAAIITGLQSELKDQIDNAKTATEKIAIAQRGIDVPSDVEFFNVRSQVELIQSGSKISRQRLAKAASFVGQDVDTAIDTITKDSQQNNVSVQQAILNYLRGERTSLVDEIQKLTVLLATRKGHKKSRAARLKTLMADLAVLDKDIAATLNDPTLNETPGQIGTITDPDTVKQQQDQAAQEAKDAALARVDFFKALQGNNPVAAAQADLEKASVEAQFAKTDAEKIQAETDRVNAEHAMKDAITAIYQAQGDYIKALVANDPVKVAQVSVAQAQLAINAAEGDAARLQAQAQLVQAQQQLQQAIFDIINSQTELALSLANAAGDTVGSAKIALQEARDKLAQAQQKGAGQAELNQLQSQVISQQAALRDAQLSDREATIDFNLQTKKISTAQAIAQYQALLNNADILGLTTQQTRDLILKIQGLRQGLSQDLQFNLPSNLRLPTLYEARRLNQSGGNYQDNRNVSINITTDGGLDPNAAVNTIVNALNQPPVFGTRPRIY